MTLRLTVSGNGSGEGSGEIDGSSDGIGVGVATTGAGVATTGFGVETTGFGVATTGFGVATGGGAVGCGFGVTGVGVGAETGGGTSTENDSDPVPVLPDPSSHSSTAVAVSTYVPPCSPVMVFSQLTGCPAVVGTAKVLEYPGPTTATEKLTASFGIIRFTDSVPLVCIRGPPDPQFASSRRRRDEQQRRDQRAADGSDQRSFRSDGSSHHKLTALRRCRTSKMNPNAVASARSEPPAAMGTTSSGVVGGMTAAGAMLGVGRDETVGVASVGIADADGVLSRLASGAGWPRRPGSGWRSQ